MGRSERRAAERRARGHETSEPLKGSKLIIYAVVTFAMAFSSLGMILAYGGPTAALWCIGVAAAVCIGLLIRKFIRDRADEQVDDHKSSGNTVSSKARRSN